MCLLVCFVFRVFCLYMYKITSLFLCEFMFSLNIVVFLHTVQDIGAFILLRFPRGSCQKIRLNLKGKDKASMAFHHL